MIPEPETQNTASGAPPVFIVGCPRSGTTLLRALLTSHPDLAIPPESHFIPRAWAVRRRYSTEGIFHAERLVDDIARTSRFRDWGLAKESVLERVRETKPGSFASTVEAIFIAYARDQHKIRWGDKTPGYSLDMPLLAALWPSAKFVHIIRDGRDVALSFLELGTGARRLLEAAAAWSNRVRKGRADGMALGNERYLEVRYEDLVADPERIVRTVCRHIRLDFRPQMLAYSSGVDRLIPKNERHLHRNLARPPTKGLRDWRLQMTSTDVQLFEAVAGSELVEFGYDRAAPAVPTGRRARAYAGLAGNAFSRASWATRRWALTRFKPESLPPPRRW